MTTTPADIIAAARMNVLQKHPYLSVTLFSLRPVEAPGLGTLAVDAGWRLYYDPETVALWHREMLEGRLRKVNSGSGGHDGVAAVVYHEMGHVLRQHHLRTGDRDPRLANMAQDREINDSMPEEGWILPGRPLLPSDIGMDNGLLFEEYYREETGASAKIMNPPPGSGCACGGAAGNPTEWEKQYGDNPDGSRSLPESGSSGAGTLPAPASPLEQEISLRKTALDIQSHQKAHGKGSVPAGLAAWAEARLLPPKIDWRKKLAQMTRASLAAAAGASDWTWRRPGRRSLHCAGRAGWPLAPALFQPVPKVEVVLDCSGSMSSSTENGRPVEDEALSEVVGIALASGAGVRVHPCDADVYGSAVIRKVADLEKVNKGGGGTNLVPGFLAASKYRPDLVIMVTDGIVGENWPSPEQVRGVRALAVIVGGTGQKPPVHIPFVEAV